MNVKKIFTAIILVCYLQTAVNAQFDQFTIRHYMEDNLSKSNKSRGSISILVPTPDGPSVKMADRQVVLQPDSISSDPDGIYFFWNIIKRKDFFKKPPVITTNLLVRRNNLRDFMTYKYADPPDPDTARHLEPESKIQSGHEVVVNFARSLKADTRLEKVQKIYDAVVQTKDLDLTPTDIPGGGALHAIREKSGHTYDYAALMTALCRASGIPARFVSGFTFEEREFDSWLYINHWVEVYFPQMGWVTFDPAGADIGKVAVCFESSGLHYIPVCYGTKNGDEVIRHYYKYSSKPLRSNVENFSLSYYIDTIRKYRKKRDPELELVIDSLLVLDKYDVNYLLTKGMMRIHAGDFETGLSLLQLSLKMAYSDYGKASAMFCMARYFALKGENEMAVRFLEKVLEKDKAYHFKLMHEEPDLSKLRESMEYKDFLARMNTK